MPLKERIVSRECITGVLTAAFGLFMYLTCDKRFGVYPRAVFLIMVGVGTIMAGMALLWAGARRTRLEKVTWYEILFIAIMVLSPTVIHYIGFYPGAFLVVLGITLLPLPEYSLRTLIRTTLYVFVVTAATYLVFSGLLQIKVPTGVLFAG